MVPAAARVVVVVTAAPRRSTGLRVLKGVLHFSHTLTVTPHYIPDMSNAVKLDFELVDLGHDLVEAADLHVGVVDEVTGVVIHRHGDDLRLLGKVIKLLRYLGHEPIKMTTQLRKGTGVEQQQALG